MKSYYADSVQIAMEEARRELGGDAILVTSRLAPAEAGKPRQYEVVFASETAAQSATEPRKVSHAPIKPLGSTGPDSIGSGPMDSVLKEVREIRAQLDSLKQTNGRQVDQSRWITEPGAKDLFARLVSAEVDSDLAQQILASAMKRITKADTGGRFFEVLRAVSDQRMGPAHDLQSAAAAEIRGVFRVETGFDHEPDQTTIAALIGPPGTGKTASIAKLAVRYGITHRRPTLLISADTRRVGSTEQLRSYASVLGLRFEVATSARALGQILEDQRGTGLILIDTPGFSPHQLDASNELARFLADRPDVQKHLVLPASGRGSDISRVSSAYDIFRPSHLIFSRFDETKVFGPVLSEGMENGRPVSFFTTGQQVPEDIEEASADILISHILPVSAPQHRMAAAA